jgi:hypothetical protein
LHDLQDDSGEESKKGVGSTALGDLNSYLRTLDQDDLLRGGASKLGKGRGPRPDISGIKASTQQLLQNNSLKFKKTDSIPAHRPGAQGERVAAGRGAIADSGVATVSGTTDGSSLEGGGQRKQATLSNLPKKVVHMALKIVDGLISDAVRTVEVGLHV